MGKALEDLQERKNEGKYIPMLCLSGVSGYAWFCGGMCTFDSDGSGWLANQNIIWDSVGNTVFNGTVTSNNSGDRVVISAADRSVKFIGSDNIIYGSWVFSQYGSRFELEYNDNKTRLLPSGLESQLENRFGQYNYSKMSVAEFNDQNEQMRGFEASIPSDTNTLKVILKNLPKSPDSLEAGHLWNDNGIIKIIE